MRSMLTSFSVAALIAVGAAAVPSGASAMPMAQPLPLADAASPSVTLTSGGCGPFRHRGFYGGCRPNFYGGYGYGYGGPYAFYHRPFGFGFRRGYGWRHRW